MRLNIKDKTHLQQAARHFVKEMKGRKIFAFYGPMGAGKTTIIRAICEVLGVKDIVTSPTFTLVNEYKIPGGDPVYHMDFYRIRKMEEVFDFGIEEYFGSGCICFMEWPELIEDILPAGTIKVRIKAGDDGERTIETD